MFKYIIVGFLVVGAIAYIVMTNSNGQKVESKFQTRTNTMNDGILVQPIEHASAVITFGGKVIYTDPVGGAAMFDGRPAADLILLTDLHGDHLSVETLTSLIKGSTTVFAPQAVIDELMDEPYLNQIVAIHNGETKTFADTFTITAVPMYNVPESPKAFHTKGRGNGYILEHDTLRLYISGDTGNTPELRALQNIDLALLSMNLPYTMSVQDAASATLAFKPKEIMPYHYRGPDGLSDVATFKKLVEAGDRNIQVTLLDWYPNQ